MTDEEGTEPESTLSEVNETNKTPIEGAKSSENTEQDSKGSDNEASGSATTEEPEKWSVNEETKEPPKATETTTKSESPEKVKVHFVAVGSSPIMKKTKFQIGADQRFAAVTAFLRKMLKLTDSGSSLFLYCNSAFVPGPDERVGDLSECFSVRGELVIHYSLQEAWG